MALQRLHSSRICVIRKATKRCFRQGEYIGIEVGMNSEAALLVKSSAFATKRVGWQTLNNTNLIKPSIQLP